MLYATEDDLDRKFGAQQITLLGDRDNDGVRDAGVIEQALAAATRMINSRIAAKLPPVLADEDAETLRDYACDLARYELYVDIAPEHVIKRRDDTVADLNRIAEGRLMLGKADGVQPATAPTESDIEFRQHESRSGWGGGYY